ncbi:MAG: ThiF family adenylyltransferase [Anaerolineae bacterium]|jgi:molybdopterin/thiamine biosynthesis adenylyltransferase|nr:ThiF family adenylyltransferase [Anaerolineae bacterium]
MVHLSSVEVVFTGSQFDWLHAHLFQDDNKQSAFAFAAPAEGNERLKLLIQHLIPVQPEDYLTQCDGCLHLKPERVERIAQYALDHRYSLIEINIHKPEPGTLESSSIDLKATGSYFIGFAHKPPHPFHHIKLVFSPDSADGIIYESDSGVTRPIDRVTVLGHPIRRYDVKPKGKYPQGDTDYLARYNRQVQAFGERGQAQVKATRVGIVGLGGVGSAVTQQLALLGVREFVLVDGDILEESNLNRFVGANWDDASRHRKKAEVIQDFLETLDPTYMNITVHATPFPTPSSVDALKICDVLFGCTDTHGSRLLLNNFAVQYMLPYIDIGVGINTNPDGTLAEAGGQYRVVMPDGYCLECVRAINPVLAADDLRSTDQQALRQAHGYIPTENISAPSVAFLNNTLVSLAVGEFLNLLTAFRSPQRLVYYFLNDHSTRTIHAHRRTDCVVCGGDHLAMGDLEPVVGLNTVPPIAPLDLPVPTHGRPSNT